MTGSMAERFWGHVDIRVDGCWTWTASTVRGYGRFYTEGRGRGAHRVSYELLVGPIPEGLVIDHLCRNPSCVRPDHLEPVTNGENVRRGITSEVLRAYWRSYTHCKHGHELTDENVYVQIKGQLRIRSCLTCRRAVHRRLSEQRLQQRRERRTVA